MLRSFHAWRGRWAGLFLLALLPGSVRGASYEVASTNTVLNQGSTSAWTVQGNPTPGQFRGAIIPSRFVYQRTAEIGGVSLSPKQRRFAEVLGNFTWEQADADARERGGHLAVITSQAEHNEMLAAIGNPGPVAGSRWLGASDAAREGTWTWVTGESFVYSHWAGGEPNNAGDEDFVSLIRTGGSAGRWNDLPFWSVQGGYILEIESNSEVVRGGTGSSVRFVQSMLVGMPYVAKASEFLIGSVIAPPGINEKEVLLAELANPVLPQDYWEPLPNNISSSTNPAHINYGRFYFSETKEVVFATASGGVTIEWIKRQSETPKKLDGSSYGQNETPDPTLWKDRGGVYHRIFSRNYVISASPVKRPRRIYHTEGDGAQGLAVYIPSSRIAGLKVVYHKDFPEQMPVGQGTPRVEFGRGRLLRSEHPPGQRRNP
jgi:hypothetical protein